MESREGINMKKSIGIIIVYPPQILSKKEGLARYLSFLIQGCMDAGIHVTLLCPSWTDNDLTSLFEDMKISFDKTKITIKSPRALPPAVVLNIFFEKIQRRWEKERVSRIANITRILVDRSEKALPELFAKSNWFSVLIAIYAMLPATLLILMLNIVPRHKPSSSIKKASSHLFSPTIYSRFWKFFFSVYFHLIDAESQKIGAIAKKIPNFGRWIIPVPFWPEAVKTIPNSVVVCPDIVYDEFPVGFVTFLKSNIPDLLTNRERLKRSISLASHLVTYSEYTKNQHLGRYMGIDSKNVTVIPHGHIDISKSLDVLVPFSDMTRNEQKDLCLQIIHTYFKYNITNPYLQEFDISGVQYIIYTGQYRPHKNFETFLKCIHTLIHRRYRPIKCILTAGSIMEVPQIADYIRKNGLSPDVIILSDIPTKVMAALDHLSALAVNPTLMEGALPFTFSEAMSVGTPSVMSSIPVVLEIIDDPELREKMLFDPGNVNDMADHICWGLDHREELLDLERPLYDKIKNRTWEDVALEFYTLTNITRGNNG